MLNGQIFSISSMYLFILDLCPHSVRAENETLDMRDGEFLKQMRAGVSYCC